jgi:hypothetical protein
LEILDGKSSQVRVRRYILEFLTQAALQFNDRRMIELMQIQQDDAAVAEFVTQIFYGAHCRPKCGPDPAIQGGSPCYRWIPRLFFIARKRRANVTVGPLHKPHLLSLRIDGDVDPGLIPKSGDGECPVG